MITLFAIGIIFLVFEMIALALNAANLFLGKGKAIKKG